MRLERFFEAVDNFKKMKDMPLVKKDAEVLRPVTKPMDAARAIRRIRAGKKF